MITTVLHRFTSLNINLMFSLSFLSFKTVLSCFLTQKSKPSSLMVGVNITNCISIFRKMALPIESLALTLSNKMALLRESTYTY
jgi:Na+-transporting NADH:ubiquinone oxidoreductase subunit NqrD